MDFFLFFSRPKNGLFLFFSVKNSVAAPFVVLLCLFVFRWAQFFSLFAYFIGSLCKVTKLEFVLVSEFGSRKYGFSIQIFECEIL